MNEPMNWVERFEHNSAEFLLAMGRAGGGSEHVTGHIHWTAGGSPLDYHNAVVRAQLPPQECDAAIQAFQAVLIEHQVPGSWHLSPSMQPPDLAARLQAHGFTDGGDDPGMALSLTSWSSSIPTPSDFELVHVVSRGQLADYAAVLAQGFGEGEREALWVEQVFAKIGVADDVPWQHFVGYHTQLPVTTATLFFTGQTVGLYFIATAPAWRRRGLSIATTAAILRLAQQRGCELAVLAASAQGYELYRRLGFVEIAPVKLYVFEPPPTPMESFS